MISKKRRCLIGGLLIAFLILACAPGIDHYVQINRYLVEDEYDAALKTLIAAKKEYSGNSQALFYMEEGVLAHYAARYRESNQDLAQAERIMDALFTRSVSREAASFLINDLTIPYHGEDFENVMVNLFMALNYTGLDLKDDALVEARKVDNKLNLINSHYERDQKNVYKEDAFVRFLMGALYEAGGEINDAFISYRKALDIYRSDYQPNYGVSAPRFLYENLLTAAQDLGFRAEIATLERTYGRQRYTDPAQKKKLAEIYCLHYNGLMPEKREQSWQVRMPDGYLLKVAYPVFEKRPYRVSHAEIVLQERESGETYRFETELMEDIGAIAGRNLENRINRIKVKAIARATAKYLATEAAARKAKKEGGELAGLLVQMTGNIASVATERADLRHWRLLPDQIRVGRALVAPGHYEGRIEFGNRAGVQVWTKSIEPFVVESGETKFIACHTFE